MAPQVQRIACYALLIQDGKVLLCRLSNSSVDPGVWTLPGGGMEFGEHPEETLKREVWEETGLEIAHPQMLVILSEVLTLPGKTQHNLQIVYRVDIVGGELRNEVEGTTDLCAWLSQEEVDRERVVSLVQKALESVSL